MSLSFNKTFFERSNKDRQKTDTEGSQSGECFLFVEGLCRLSPNQTQEGVCYHASRLSMPDFTNWDPISLKAIALWVISANLLGAEWKKTGCSKTSRYGNKLDLNT